MKFYKTKWFMIVAAVAGAILFAKYVWPKLSNMGTTATTATPKTTTPATTTPKAVTTLAGPVLYQYN